MKTLILIGVSLAAIVAVSSADAQWLNYPTRGIPRLPDGKPDLDAPPPRTADGKPRLDGLWAHCVEGAGCLGQSLFVDLTRGVVPPARMSDWAAAVFAQRNDRQRVDDPVTRCIPPGVPRINFFNPLRIVSVPELTIFLYESLNSTFRQVFTDGRPLPDDPQPTWLGYSIGHWEADAFVIETSGFRDGGWLDRNGHPHSDALRITERFRRVNFWRLELRIIVDDPKAYVVPWSVQTVLQLRPDTELIESFCEGQYKHEGFLRRNAPVPEPPSSPLPTK